MRTYCINLDRRIDRWDNFQKRMAASGWDIGAIERFAAIDARDIKIPTEWNFCPGAYACYRSHLKLLKHAAKNTDAKAICVFEDDAMPMRDSNTREAFLDLVVEVPENFDMFYLGGQLLYADKHPPMRISETIWRAFNVNRLHAYVVSRKFVNKLISHLQKPIAPQHHIDHHIGILHSDPQNKVYIPQTWLFGQCAGKSDINNGVLGQNWWQTDLSRFEKKAGYAS